MMAHVTAEAVDVKALPAQAAYKTIRASLLMLVLLATAFCGENWDSWHGFSKRVSAFPLLLFAVVVSFAVAAFIKTRPIARLQDNAIYALGHSAPIARLETHGLLQTVTASRDNLRDLVDSLPLAIFTLSLDGKVRSANKRFAQLVNRSFSEIVGESLSDMVIEPSLQQLQDAASRLVEERHWSGLVRVCLAKKRNWRYFQCHVCPILQDNQLVALSVVAEDVTVEREREKVLLNLLQILHEPVWIVNSEGRVLDCNGALPNMLGRQDRETLLESNLIDLVPEGQRKELTDALMSGLPIRDLKLDLIRSDGSSVKCLANALPSTDVSGSATYHGVFAKIENYSGHK